MRRFGVMSLLFLGILAIVVQPVATTAWAQTSSPKPPTNLKLVGDHWTPWDPPEAGPDAYIIKKGDTLWDLSQQWLGDPYLWPQIWDENRYILDSHWIYPGDPLVIPGKPTVIAEDGPPPSSMSPEPTGGFGRDSGADSKPATPLPPPLLPLASATDIYCSGWIDANYEPSDLVMVGAETEKIAVAQGDVIYLNRGRDWGLRPGDSFAMVRSDEQVVHPSSGEEMGTYVKRLGRARVMLVQETKSIAVIDMSCQDILPNDQLISWEVIPIPQARSMPDFDRYDANPSGGATGQIVSTSQENDMIATGHIIHTDLGQSNGLRPGDVLTLYKLNGELPRINLGQGVVLTVEPQSSTVKVTRSVREMVVGDWAEVR